MKFTYDKFTGKPFAWNDTDKFAGYVVPAFYTRHVADSLHPSRVPDDLLRELNPDKPIPWKEG